MKATLVLHKNNEAQVNNLVNYCKQLDGTSIEVFDLSKRFTNLTYPHVCNASFRFISDKLKEPYFWLEDDSVPLQKDWLNLCTVEYTRLGKPILLSIDQQTPYDVIGGIGIYSPVVKIPKRLAILAGMST